MAIRHSKPSVNNLLSHKIRVVLFAEILHTGVVIVQIGMAIVDVVFLHNQSVRRKTREAAVHRVELAARHNNARQSNGAAASHNDKG